MIEHWESALADLRGRLSAENYEAWLGSVRFDGFDGKRLRIRIPNRFYADWIRTHYLDLLLESLRSRTSIDNIEVDWKIDEQLSRARPPHAERRPESAPPPQADRAAAPADEPEPEVPLRELRRRSVEPARARGGDGRRVEPRRALQPALHLRRRRSRQDAPRQRRRPSRADRATRRAHPVRVGRALHERVHLGAAEPPHERVPRALPQRSATCC